ncbi:rho GTPase-activating protein 11A-like [Corythoichthys intestinalis]|uniref:rho GTPase-activating protein 11A-like n=1 Tax=Corythoichthys intestinalis TaxID=161448 RepID=UPI0025A4FB4E|nr:rho GTPase-activating protein 11A-like [Corythoichthys intestinalis]
MMVAERNMVRLVAVQHLRTAYGIKTKNWNKNKADNVKSTATINSTKVFGVPLESLPYYNMARGNVPSFLVDACMKLQAHVDTEGLFRKSGSVLRLKALRAKVDSGEECLSSALPCDIASLVKQFFRELPEPVLPTELQEAFLKAQQLPSQEDRTSATVLLSCILPDRSLSVLCHFLDFLQNVSKRSAENKMDIANLSLILAPNLLHCGEGTEKMNANTEKRIRLQTAVVHCFIEHAHNFGVLPQFLEEKVSAMMHSDPAILSPAFNELQELDQNSETRRRNRQSLGVFSSVTPVIATPSSKRKLPFDSGHSFGFSNKKRRSVKKNLGMESLPNYLFGTSTPGSAYSASGVLDSSPSTLSSAGKFGRLSTASARRKSRRVSGRHAVSRVESGRAGCFSPKVSKHEVPRKSLRQRFSLGRNHKDIGSESIGLRLASQESAASFCFTKEIPAFNPPLLPRNTQTKSSKFISKSEDNLLTPQCEPGAHCASWNSHDPGEVSFPDTPTGVRLKSNCVSEPAFGGSGLPKKLCCATGEVSLESETSVSKASGQIVTEVEKAVVEMPSVSVLLPSPKTPTVPSRSGDTPKFKFPAHRKLNVTFDAEALSPLHIDSVVLDPSGSCSKAPSAAQSSFSIAAEESEDSPERAYRSRLIEALDIQSPAHFEPGISPGLQSTPYAPRLEPTVDVHANQREKSSVPDAGTPKCRRLRVVDHIQRFNKLTLKSPRGAEAKHVKSPLKFQRTPVRQAVRRINSLIGESKRPAGNVDTSDSRGIKSARAVSLESGLSPQRPFLKKAPPVPPKKPSSLAAKVKACALGDVTNKLQTKANGDSSISGCAAAHKVVSQQLAGNEVQNYQGTVRNKLGRPRLLPATKPVDL